MTEDILASLLERAETAFARREEEEALPRLLEAWRESRAERLAALVDRVSARVVAGQPPLERTPLAPDLEPRRPVDLPRMLGGLLETARSGRVAELGRQLDGLRRGPADPRLTPVLLDIARLPIAQDRQASHELCGLLTYVRDPRALAELRELCAGLDPESLLAERLHTVLRMTESQEVTALSPEALARCDALEAAVAARDEAEARSAPIRESLLARVHAHPEDLDARLVLADHLLEQGDPLGEFIALQCSPHPDEARLDALRAKYAPHWLGPLGPFIVPGNTLFERGFPAAVSLAIERRQASLPPPAPAWSTVQDIDWSCKGPPEAAAWLAHPHLRGVTRLRRVWAGLGERLGLYPLPVKRLELQGQLTVRAPDTFRLLGGLPHLSQVELPEAESRDVVLCATSPLARRLDRFEARAPRAWTLVVTPSAEVSVDATLLSERHCEAFAEVIRAAASFGNRVLRLSARCQLDDVDVHLLNRAGAVYERVEWVSLAP